MLVGPPVLFQSEGQNWLPTIEEIDCYGMEPHTQSYVPDDGISASFQLSLINM